MEHNPVADCSEAYHPIVVAGLAGVDPMADAADAVQVAERRIADAPVGRPGCIDCEPRDCKPMSPVSSGIDVLGIVVGSFLDVEVAAGCSHLRVDRTTAVATCTVARGLWSSDSAV